MFPQQGWRNTSGGGSGDTNLPIQNTLWVMKNGDDTTALPHRLDKPFLTIQEASNQAVTGDTIYVVAGTYNERDSPFAGDIYYVLEDGVTVICDTVVISDGGTRQNINISGSGTLRTSNAGSAVVNILDSRTVLNLECDIIFGEGTGISCSGEFNINVNQIIINSEKAIALTDLIGGGDKTFGTINVNNIETVADDVVIDIYGCNTDQNQRNIFININEINCLVNSSPCLNISQNNKTRVYFKCTTFNQTGSDNILSCDTSYLYINDSNLISAGKGMLLSDDSITLFTNSNIVADSSVISTIPLASTLNAQFNNCTLKTTSDSMAIELTQLAELYLSNCIIVSGSGGTNSVFYIISTSILRLRNCQIISNDVSVTYSISADAPSNIYIYGQCSSNRPTDAILTNQVAGTNIIVDTDIIQNTTNFY